MTLEKIKTPKIEIEMQGEKWNCEFQLRNYAVLRERFDIREHELLKGLMEGQPKYIAYAIWASTLVFASPFDPANPLKLEKEMDLLPLFELNLPDLQALGDQVVKAMEAALPQPTEAEKAKAEKEAFPEKIQRYFDSAVEAIQTKDEKEKAFHEICGAPVAA